MGWWVVEWVSEWINEWMNEWMSGWVSGWVNEWMDVWMNEWLNKKWMNGWIKEKVNEWREEERKKVALEKTEKEVIRRVSVFLETPLSDQNKINAISTFASSILTFLMSPLSFSYKDLNEVELKIKCLVTKKGARHPQHLNTLLYASRLIGSRGLRELTNIYKIKIKSALRITTSKCPKLQAVAQFQQAEELKDRRSMLKVTNKCAVDMRMILELANHPILSFETT